MASAGENAASSGFSCWEAEACRCLVELGLAEDLNAGEDLTTVALVDGAARAEASFVARSPGVLAGLPAVEAVCRAVDPALLLQAEIRDGQPLEAGTVIARVRGPARGLLGCERLALNFLNHLSGIATLTRQFVRAVADTPCQIYDTRKTLPGWRALEKYAVRQGGGHNHRAGLYDAVLIKDNHLAYWHSSQHPDGDGSLAAAVRHARATAPSPAFVEVEVEAFEQLGDALKGEPDFVLLDNMDTETLRRAVLLRDRIAPQVVLEASGGITLETVTSVACTGVERVSIGALTQSALALDIGLDWIVPRLPR